MIKFIQTLLIFFFVLVIAGQQASAEEINKLQKDPFSFSRMNEYSSKELIQYLTLEYCNWHYEQFDEEWVADGIRDELIKKKDIDELLSAFENAKDSFQKQMIVEALYKIEDQKTFSAFEKYLSSEISDTMYYCANYLAKQGYKNALKILNDNYFKYGVSSWQWSYTVELFGKYQYKPAIPNLIWSLDAASLNLVGAAQNSLEQLFPGTHPDFESISEMKEYFSNLYKNTNKTINPTGR